MKKIPPELENEIMLQALIRIQLRFNNISYYKRLDYIFAKTHVVDGVVYDIHFIRRIKMFIKEEEFNSICPEQTEDDNTNDIARTFKSLKIKSSPLTKKLDDLTYAHSKGKIEKFSTYLNIQSDLYLQDEIKNIKVFIQKYSHLPVSIRNKYLLDFKNPLPN